MRFTTLICPGIVFGFFCSPAAAQFDFEATVNDEGFVVVSELDQFRAWSASGVDIRSTEGHLVPIPPGDTTAPADPFTFLLANTAFNVLYAAIPGTLVDFDGPFVTSVGYASTAAGPSGDLEVSVGCGTFSQVGFPVTVTLEPETQPKLVRHGRSRCSSVDVRFAPIARRNAEVPVIEDAVQVSHSGLRFLDSHPVHAEVLLNQNLSLDRYDITGESAEWFDVVDFMPTTNLRSQTFGVSFDPNAPLGDHRAVLSFESFIPEPTQVSFELFARVVPEPRTGLHAIWACCLATGLRRRRK